MRPHSLLAALTLAFVATSSVAPVARSAETENQPSPIENLRAALTFHASFDRSADAEFARGEPRVFTAVGSGKRPAATPGLPATSKNGPQFRSVSFDFGQIASIIGMPGITGSRMTGRELP